MENRGLIFIPDISGFTQFINATEIEHSRHVIQELLEIIINANQTGLEISEIEGDAILFYKYGDMPDINVLYKQVEKMFWEFHRHLEAYDKRRICQCTACKSAVDLTLKIITHYGEFTTYNVKNFSKLIGKDIILAHQLLKNDIEHHEYWLLTDNLTRNKRNGDLPEWINWNNSSKQTENGEVLFQYTYLSPLKDQIPPEKKPDYEIPEKVKVISLSREIDADINTLFYTTANFSIRDKWRVDVKKTDHISHILPEVGTRHRCILEKGESVLYTSNYSYTPEKIVYGETEENKKYAANYTFEKLSETKTKITVDLFLKKNFISLILFRLMVKNKIETQFRRSLEKLGEFVKEVKLPVEVR